MKVIFQKWWNGHSSVFSIINYRKAWKDVGNPPLFRFRTNGATKKNGATCLDVHLEIGYTVINYTNFNFNSKNNGGNI